MEIAAAGILAARPKEGLQVSARDEDTAGWHRQPIIYNRRGDVRKLLCNEPFDRWLMQSSCNARGTSGHKQRTGCRYGHSTAPSDKPENIPPTEIIIFDMTLRDHQRTFSARTWSA